MLIEIPKGHNLPSFENTGIPEAQILSHDSAPKQDVAPTAAQNIEVAALHGGHEARWYGRSAAGFAIIVATSVIAIFSAGLWIGNRWLPSRVATRIATASSESSFDKSPDPVKAFWASFLGNDPTPVIAYPDAVFLLDDTNDLFRFQRGATDFRGAPVDSHLAEQFAENPALVARAGQLYYENAYLGFGELKAVGMLSNLFGQMGMKPIVKPSREVTVDDLKQHNVIMLGSSSQNFAVAQLNTMGDFSFKSADSRKEHGGSRLLTPDLAPARCPSTVRNVNSKSCSVTAFAQTDKRGQLVRKLRWT